MRPASLVLLSLLCPAGDGLHQLYPVEALLLPPLHVQLRHLHGNTGVLGRGQTVVPQCLVDVTRFSEHYKEHIYKFILYRYMKYDTFTIEI